MDDYFFPVPFTSKFDGISGITTRLAGDQKKEEGRRLVSRLLGISYHTITTAEQIHGSEVAIVRESDIGKHFPQVDGLISALPEVTLAILVADCLPVFIYHPDMKIIGLIHVGWRGTLVEILPRTINLIVEKFTVSIQNFYVTIGPHICRKCYRVPWFPVARAFSEAFPCKGSSPLSPVVQEIAEEENRIGEKFWSVDLALANLLQLQKVGVPEENINISKVCTFEDERFFSYRREKTLSRQMALLKLNFS